MGRANRKQKAFSFHLKKEKKRQTKITPIANKPEVFYTFCFFFFLFFFQNYKNIILTKRKTYLLVLHTCFRRTSSCNASWNIVKMQTAKCNCFSFHIDSVIHFSEESLEVLSFNLCRDNIVNRQ